MNRNKQFVIAALAILLASAVFPIVSFDDGDECDASPITYDGGSMTIGAQYKKTVSYSSNITKMKIVTCSGANVFSGSGFVSTYVLNSEMSTYSGKELYIYFSPTSTNVSIKIQYTASGDWWDWSHEATVTGSASYNWTFSYDLDGGTRASSPTPTTGSTSATASIQFPSVTKTGYTLTAWKIESGVHTYTYSHSSSKISVPLADLLSDCPDLGNQITFKAVWESAPNMSVTVGSAGSTIKLTSSVTANWSITSGGSCASLSNASGKTVTVTPISNGTVKVKAVNSNNTSDTSTYTFYISSLKFDANGGSNAPSAMFYIQTSSSSHSFSIPYGTPFLSGSSFVGYSTSSSASSASYSQGGSISVSYTSSKMLYAVWGKTSTISYDANGGSGAPSTQSFDLIGTTTVTLSSSAPSRTDYVFMGWATSSGSKVPTYDAGGSYSLSKGASVTLYAVWGQYGYLSFNANGGSGAPSTQSVLIAAGDSGSIQIPSAAPTKSGHKFMGYATTSSATDASYQPGAKVSVSAGSTVTLYAVWLAKSYYYAVLEYDANGGTGAPTSQSDSIYDTATSGSKTFTVSSVTPSKAGCTFLGWSASQSATVPSYTAGSSVTVSYDTTTRLYAVWQNSSIVVSGTPEAYAIVGSAWSFTPIVNIAGCSFSISGCPWLVQSGNALCGTPSSPGTYDVTLTASKTNYQSATQDFTITVLSSLTFESSPTGGAIIYAI